MYCFLGFYEEAIDNHKEEIHCCEALGDTIGVAVGHRMVGECLCHTLQFDDALDHQNIHLKVNIHFLINFLVFLITL